MILPWPMYEAAVSTDSDAGTLPSPAVTPTCQSSPIPKESRAVVPRAVLWIPFALSGVIALMKAVLQERRKESVRVPPSILKLSRLLNV